MLATYGIPEEVARTWSPAWIKQVVDVRRNADAADLLRMVNLAVAAANDEEGGEAIENAQALLDQLAGSIQDPYFLDPNAQPDWATLNQSGLLRRVSKEVPDAASSATSQPEDQ